jgi:hypothetical protein
MAPTDGGSATAASSYVHGMDIMFTIFETIGLRGDCVNFIARD